MTENIAWMIIFGCGSVCGLIFCIKVTLDEGIKVGVFAFVLAAIIGGFVSAIPVMCVFQYQLNQLPPDETYVVEIISRRDNEIVKTFSKAWKTSDEWYNHDEGIEVWYVTEHGQTRKDSWHEWFPYDSYYYTKRGIMYKYGMAAKADDSNNGSGIGVQYGYNPSTGKYGLGVGAGGVNVMGF